MEKGLIICLIRGEKALKVEEWAEQRDNGAMD